MTRSRLGKRRAARGGRDVKRFGWPFWYQKATVAMSSSRSTWPSILPLSVSSAEIQPVCSMSKRRDFSKRTGSAICQRYMQYSVPGISPSGLQRTQPK
jgi:hypothetical protein